MHVKWMGTSHLLSTAALAAIIVSPVVMSEAHAEPQATTSTVPFVLTVTGSDNFAGQYVKEDYPHVTTTTKAGENGLYQPPSPSKHQLFNLASLRLYVDGKSTVVDYGAQFAVDLSETNLRSDVAFGYISKEDFGRVSLGRQHSLDWTGFDQSFTWGVSTNKFGDNSTSRGFGPNHNWGQASVGYGGINTRADAISATLGSGTDYGVDGNVRITYVTPVLRACNLVHLWGLIQSPMVPRHRAITMWLIRKMSMRRLPINTALVSITRLNLVCALSITMSHRASG